MSVYIPIDSTLESPMNTPSGVWHEIPGQDFLLFPHETNPVPLDEAIERIRNDPSLKKLLIRYWQDLAKQTTLPEDAPRIIVELLRMRALEDRVGPMWPELSGSRQLLELALTRAGVHAH